MGLMNIKLEVFMSRRKSVQRNMSWAQRPERVDWGGGGALQGRVEVEVWRNRVGRQGYGPSWSLRPPAHFKGAQTILKDLLMNSKQVRVQSSEQVS